MQKSPRKFLKAYVGWVQDECNFDQKSGALSERTSVSAHDRTITTPNERGSYMVRMKQQWKQIEKCKG